MQVGFLRDFETSTKELFWPPETKAGAAARKRNVTLRRQCNGFQVRARSALQFRFFPRSQDTLQCVLRAPQSLDGGSIDPIRQRSRCLYGFPGTELCHRPPYSEEKEAERERPLVLGVASLRSGIKRPFPILTFPDVREQTRVNSTPWEGTMSMGIDDTRGKARDDAHRQKELEPSSLDHHGDAQALLHLGSVPSIAG